MDWERTKVRLSSERTPVDSYCLFVGRIDFEDADNVQSTCIIDANVYLTLHRSELPQTFTRTFMEKWDIILIEAKIIAPAVQLKEIIVSANLMDYRNKNELHSINSELTFRIHGRASADPVRLGYNSVES